MRTHFEVATFLNRLNNKGKDLKKCIKGKKYYFILLNFRLYLVIWLKLA